MHIIQSIAVVGIPIVILINTCVYIYIISLVSFSTSFCTKTFVRIIISFDCNVNIDNSEEYPFTIRAFCAVTNIGI